MLSMKSPMLTLLVSAICSFTAAGQSAAPNVVNSSGGTFQKGYYIFDWSVGELSLVNQLEGSNLVVTNGFIQPFTHDFSNRNDHSVFTNDEIRILPNPTRDILEIDFRTKQRGNIYITLIDVPGNILYKKQSVSNGDGHFQRIDMTGYASGTYVLHVTLKPNPGSVKKSGTYKIVKLN